jgi:hypothetical protein
MNKLIRAIENIVSPLEAACRFGLTPKVSDELHVIDCPCCGQCMFILDTGFVCSQSGCTFRAGSPMDLLAALEHKQIREIWNSFQSAFGDLLTRMAKIEENAMVEDALSHFQARRRLFEFFLRCALEDTSQQIRCIRQRGALQRMGVDTGVLSSSLYILTENRLRALSHALAHFGKSAKSNPGQAPIVLPYFANHHTITDLIILSSTKNKPHIINVEPHAKISWFGLLQTHPAVKEVEIAESYADCLMYNSRHASASPDKICLHYIYHPGEGGGYWKPQKATYVLEKDTLEGIPAICRLDRCLPGLNLKMAVEAGTSVMGVPESVPVKPARIFVVERAIRALTSMGLTPETKLLFESLSPKASERDQIMTSLMSTRQFDTADKLRALFRTLVVFHDDKYTLHESPTGYFLTKDSGEPQFITNFTVNIKNNLVFADASDIFHEGEVTVADRNFPIFLKPTDIDNLQDMEIALRSNSGKFGNGEKLPTIRDRQAARILTTYLRNCIAAVSHVEGIPFLGFNESRTRFFGSFFYADETTKCHILGDPIYHPFAKLEDYFSVPKFVTTPHEAASLDKSGMESNIELARLIAQLCSMLVRYYLRIFTIKPITLDGDESEAIVNLLKEVTGQHTTIQLNTNVRWETTDRLKGINGYPAHVLGTMTASESSKLNLPGIVFVPGGHKINEVLDPQAILNIQQTFRHILFAVLDWIFSTKAKKFKTVQNVTVEQQYAQEGSQIIREACGLDTWEVGESAFPGLESILSRTPKNKVRNIVSHNVNEHLITIDCSSHKEHIDIKTICDEVKRLGAKRISSEANKVTADSNPILEALENFYLQSVVLEEIFDADQLLADR